MATTSDDRCNSLALPTEADIFSTLSSQKYVSYDSTRVETEYQFALSSSDEVLASYTFTLPEVLGGKNLYSVVLVMEADFVLAGAASMRLKAMTQEGEKRGKGSDNKPLYAVATHSNVRTLRALLSGGTTFSLELYNIGAYTNKSLSRCAPLDLAVSIEHVQQEVDFINCPAPRLPNTFNQEGYLDNGYLYYVASPFLNLTSQAREVAFSISQKSYFRVVTMEHRVDIDLTLFDTVVNRAIFTSNRLEGSEEGIFSILEPGTYKIIFSVFGTYSSRFCETFDVQVAISPYREFESDLKCPHKGI